MKILHCIRTPVGGSFRHVRDLAAAQEAAGHQVGIICDAVTGSEYDDKILQDLASDLSLGLTQTPMQRQIGPSDLSAAWQVYRQVRSLNPDVLHGHGAKGGAYARTIGTLLRATGKCVARIYTPHGGSLHYEPDNAAGKVYLGSERLLERMTDAFVFVSRYEADQYAAKVCKTAKPVFLARNGLHKTEFEPAEPNDNAADFVFIGSFRDLKGPDVLIDALALLAQDGTAPRTVFVGSGDDKERYRAMIDEKGLAGATVFHDPMPVREALPLGRTVVVPSRSDSMPYIVLETGAAGRALVSTHVGGIPEIFGELSDRLVPPGNAKALAGALKLAISHPRKMRDDAHRLQNLIRREFTVEAMARSVESAYRVGLGTTDQLGETA